MSMDGVSLKKRRTDEARDTFVAPKPVRPSRSSPPLNPSASADFDEMIKELDLSGGRTSLKSSRGALVNSDDRHSPLITFNTVSSDDKSSTQTWGQLFSHYFPIAEYLTPLFEAHRNAGKRMIQNVDAIASTTTKPRF